MASGMTKPSAIRAERPASGGHGPHAFRRRGASFGQMKWHGSIGVMQKSHYFFLQYCPGI